MHRTLTTLRNAIIIGILVLLVMMALRTDSGSAKTSESDSSVRAVICQVFGPYCRQALRVAHCESRYRTWAQNGQYLGIFQMGSWERRTYGHGNTAYEQARAAYRYFVASGRDWSPWECKPWS